VAREYTRVKLTIWNDPDFRCLTSDAQWLYFVLMTHPSISLCGVVDWREARLTAIAADMSVERLRAAAVALGRGRFIAVDPETEESLVRSFVRHDGVLKSPNMARAMVRQHAEIASLKIMELVSVEVRRATVENPEWKGLAAAEPVWKQYPESDGLGIDMVPETLSEGFVEPFQNGSDLVPLSHKPITLTSKDVSTHAQSQAIERDRPSRFEDFWEAYPRKTGKGKAKPLYERLVRRHGELPIIEGARRFAADPNLPEKQFVPHPTTWLNREGWLDEPLPPRTQGSSHASPALSRVEQAVDVARELYDIENHDTLPEITS
jgi:hypothetical protein